MVPEDRQLFHIEYQTTFELYKARIGFKQFTIFQDLIIIVSIWYKMIESVFLGIIDIIDTLVSAEGSITNLDTVDIRAKVGPSEGLGLMSNLTQT